MEDHQPHVQSRTGQSIENRTEWRNSVNSRVDLHTHTTASDGRLSPEALVAEAARLGVEVVAITDHDTTGGVQAARAAGRRLGVTVVPGVEISALDGRQELHLLGYFVDIRQPGLQDLLRHSRQARWVRARQMTRRLSGLGLPLSWEQLAESAAETQAIGRQHIALALLEAGLVGSTEEAFDLWIGRDGPAYVERYKLSPEEAIHCIAASGGLAVLAHPYILSRGGVVRSSLDLQSWLPRLRQAGLSGLEVYYPNYPPYLTRRLLDLATAHKLIPTGGSDFHGTFSNHGLGSVSVPWVLWTLLKSCYRQQHADRLAAGS